MSQLTLWKLDASPPTRAVQVLGDILGLKFELIDTDFANMGHKSPEYMKLNPLGTVPLLKDGDFYLTDSHAMLKYLLEKYGSAAQREQLYPRELRARALVDQAMFFDTGVYFIKIKLVALPTIFEGMKEIPKRIFEDIESCYHVVDSYVGDKPYIAGEQLTLADISVGITTAAMQPIHKLDKNRYPRAAAWLDRLFKIPEFKKHAEISASLLGQILETYWAKNKNQ